MPEPPSPAIPSHADPSAIRTGYSGTWFESKQKGPGFYFWEDVTQDEEGNEVRTRRLESHVVIGERPKPKPHPHPHPHSQLKSNWRPKVDGGDELRDLPLATEYIEPAPQEEAAAGA